MSTTSFANPEAGSLSSGRFETPPEVDYAAMKTPETFVADVTREKVATARANFKLGFHFYDRELETPARVPIDKFSFVVLDVFSGVSGYRETQPGQPSINYFSNFVKNGQQEPFAIWEKGIKRPILKGFYSGKKHENDFAKLVKFPITKDNEILNSQPGNFAKIPDGAGFHQHFFVYWIEGKKMLNLKLTTMVSREIKSAISRAEARAHRKVKPENVQLFKLASGNALWGFEVTAFRRATKDGADYAGKGEMFLVPKFECGVVMATGENSNPTLHAISTALQQQLRIDYAMEVERRKQFGLEGPNDANEPVIQAPPPDATDDRFPSHEPGSVSSYGQQYQNFRQDYGPPLNVDQVDNVPPPPDAGDDLPF